MSLSEKLREAFQRKRYGSEGDYDPDFDLFDAAADEIDRLQQDVPMPKPDDAEEVAKEAYAIYRGMVRSGPVPPHWDDLPVPEKGLMAWIIRFDRLQRS